ncbi:MAG: archaellar assembly protein FlaJ [Candidatus Thermoplasmatota archaeon]|jgi:flagellar protein FlaJ|nr:archaellar assembly protein FlaJ [Candidatus Thermoplasmatota archaeon]
MDDVIRLGKFSNIEFKKNDVFMILAASAMAGVFLGLYLIFNSLLTIILTVVAILAMTGMVLKPVIDRDSKRANINANIPFFVTSLATLSTSGANRIDVLDILSKKEKIGMIKDDLKKIVNLVMNWKRGLSEAANVVARKTPSDLFADFLDRFGQALDSGQDFIEFVNLETDAVMSNFETAYISALATFDIYKDMYVSLLLAFAFLIAFILIMPVLIPINIILLLAFSLITVSLGEFMLLYGIKMVLPNDPIWHGTGIKTEVQKTMEKKFMIAGMISGLILIVFLVTKVAYVIPFYFTVTSVVTPFAWPSIVGSRMEKSIGKKDDMFGSFMRSLSGSASARGNMIIDAMKSMIVHDFGMMTKDVKNLYKRLVYRIDSIIAWKNFSADTGSHLIELFTESFVESVELGADAAAAGNIVSTNVDKITRLRRRRRLSVNTFTGVIYGITGGLAFSLAISFGILEIIDKVFKQFAISGLATYGIFFSPPSATILSIEIFLFAILYIHAGISGISMKIADGGRKLHGIHHIVIMMWIISIVVYGTLQITTILLGSSF